jgi:hypothetical protein
MGNTALHAVHAFLVARGSRSRVVPHSVGLHELDNQRASKHAPVRSIIRGPAFPISATHSVHCRYSYMRDSYGVVSNPFDVGCAANTCDRLCPSQTVYYQREEVEESYMRPTAQNSFSYQPVPQQLREQLSQQREMSAVHNSFGSSTRRLVNV